MKFDCIIMNPPYSKNLHLKILAEAITYLNNDNSKCINLSPVRWLQDPVAKYKNKSYWKTYDASIRKHIKDLEIISRKDAANLFKIRQNEDLAIYVTEKNIHNNIDCEKLFSNAILDKVITLFPDVLANHLENNISTGWRVRHSDLRPLNGGSNGEGKTAGFYYKFELLHHFKSWVYYDGFQNRKHWSWYNGKTGCKVFTEKDKLPCSIKFNLEIEATNYENSTKTLFFRYLFQSMKLDQHTPFKFLPFMSDYTQPWTDERFYKFFNITKEEQKIIEDTMAKYKSLENS